MKISELKGKRVLVVVNETPCRIVMDGAVPLEATTWATVSGAMKMPCGYVMFVTDDVGTRIAIDETDIKIGRVVIELHERKTEAVASN